MKTRVITALVGCCVLIPVLIFSGTIVFPVACAVCSLVSAFEMCACLGIGRKWYFAVPAYLYAVALPLLSYWLFLNDVGEYICFAAVLSFLLILWNMAAAVFRSGGETFALLSKASIGIIYTVCGFMSLALLRRMPGGEYLFLLVFFGAWVTDIMAYFTGYFFGKHHLSPHISPKKTVEGSLGGVIFCAASYILYGYIIKRLTGTEPWYLFLGIGGAVISVVAQIGDLAASLIKREHGIKDYGKILPGHGGILDRFDSMLTIAPLLLLLCNFSAAFHFFTV